MQSRTVLSGVLALSIGGAAWGAELVVNGGFEAEPNFGAGFANDAGFSGFTGNQVPGWTIAAGHALTIHNTVFYPTITPTYSANLDGEGFGGTNADFYQDVSATLGQPYQVSYDYQGWNQSTTVFTVSVTDLTTSTVLFTQASPWQAALATISAPLVGTGNPLRLRIMETPTGFNDNAFIVDNFSIRTVPEPVSAGLLGVALLARRLR